MALSGSTLLKSSWSNQFGLYFTWSASQSIGGNYSDITVNTYAWLGQYGYLEIGSRGDNYSNIGGNAIGVYSPGVTKYYSSEATILLNTRVHRVYHNPDGTLPNVYIRFVWYIRAYINGIYRDNIDCSFYTGAINTIPRASKITSDASITIPNNLQIKIQSYYNAFTHDVTLKVNGNTIRTLTGVKGTQNITFTDEEIQSFYTETTKKYLTSQITVVTKNGNTTIGTATKTGKFSFNEGENKPTFDNFTFEPLDQGTKDLTEWTTPVSADNGKSIKNKTIYKINCSTPTFKNGATLSYYLVELNGKSYKSTSSTIELDTPITYADYLKVSVVDSRGFKTTVSKQLTVLDYNDPVPQEGFSIERQTYPNNEDVKITGTVKFTKTDIIKNNIAVYIQYKDVNSETWSERSAISFTQTGDTITIDYTKTGFDLDTLYDFEVIINDYYDKDVIVEALVLKDIPDIKLKHHDIEIDGESIKSGELNTITVGRNTRQYITNTSSTPIAYNYIKKKKGDKLTLSSNGAVVIGKGIKYVKVSCLVWLEAYNGYSNVNIAHRRAGTILETGGVNIFPDGPINNEVWRSQSIADCFFEVEEGDEIISRVIFSAAHSSNNIAGNYANAVLMMVEAITSKSVLELNSNVEPINDPSILLKESDVVSVTPSNCSNYSGYGNTYYYKKGTRVHVHIGVQGLTAGTLANVFTLPIGFRPKTLTGFHGVGSVLTTVAGCQIDTNGSVKIMCASSQYALFDMEFDAFK